MCGALAFSKVYFVYCFSFDATFFGYYFSGADGFFLSLAEDDVRAWSMGAEGYLESYFGRSESCP